MAYNYPSLIIAERIQKVFDKNNITDSQVANSLKCDRKCILGYRNGYANPSIKFIRWLCATYKIDANWLLDIREDTKENDC